MFHEQVKKTLNIIILQVTTPLMTSYKTFKYNFHDL